jgi:hypothetical protein
VTELEQRLEAAAGAFPFPPTPSLRAAVLARLPERRSIPWRKAIVIVAMAAVAVTLTAVFSPGARSAFRDWFDFIPGVRIERVEKLPPSNRLQAFDLGQEVSLDQARREARFGLRLPSGLGRPTKVYLDRDPARGVGVTVLYGNGLALTEWRSDHVFFYKLLEPGTTTQAVYVDGVPGLWLSGGDHAVFYLGADGIEYQHEGRLAGSVLLWQRGRTAYRLEARVPRRRALRIAESLSR